MKPLNRGTDGQAQTTPHHRKEGERDERFN